MVSKASDDLPEPETPVSTTSASRGMATSTLRRLCSCAPWIRICRCARDGPPVLRASRPFAAQHARDRHLRMLERAFYVVNRRAVRVGPCAYAPQALGATLAFTLSPPKRYRV